DDKVLEEAEAEVEEVRTHAHQVAGHEVVRHLVGVVPADETARNGDPVEFVGDRGEEFPCHVVFTLRTLIVENVVPRRTGDGQVDGVAGEFGQPLTAITVPEFVVELAALQGSSPFMGEVERGRPWLLRFARAVAVWTS